MKKVIIGILILLFVTAFWYLFIKKYDYEIAFKANMAPIGVYHQVKNIKSHNKKSSDEKTLNFSDLGLKQEVVFDQEKVFLDWKFKSVNDTITKINVGIISKDHSIKNRLKVLVGSSSLVKLVKEDLIQFRKTLLQYTNTFRVVIEGVAETPDIEALLVSSEIKRSGRASEMMSQNSYLYPKLIANGVNRKGYPFVKIRHWDSNKDMIQMDFGVPIIYNDTLPTDPLIKYERIKAQKALKASYFGNYRNSDEAWFALLEYARSNNIAVEKQPLEIFYNNPMQDGNEKDWKAEIFLPLK